MTPDQITQAVDAVLAAARLPVTGEDYARLQRNYPSMLSQLATLRFSEMRSCEPAVIYPALSSAFQR